MKMVYIAGPYRAEDKRGVEKNIAAARFVAVELLKALHKKPVVKTLVGHGYDDAPESRSLLERYGHNAPYPVIPHMNTALFDFDEGISTIDADYWLKGTMTQMDACAFVVLVRPDAAMVSRGTFAEVYRANILGIPVFEDVKAFIYFLENERFQRQVYEQTSAVAKIPLYQRGKDVHIFGAPENDQPQSPQQIP